eukprot:2039238-Prymnesium_polylepis.1
MAAEPDTEMTDNPVVSAVRRMSAAIVPPAPEPEPEAEPEPEPELSNPIEWIRRMSSPPAPPPAPEPEPDLAFMTKVKSMPLVK